MSAAARPLVEPPERVPWIPPPPPYEPAKVPVILPDTATLQRAAEALKRA